ncbi:hypothetical protein PIB30_005489 [Stylosanthes scabra]|uniref:Uncharacterized protein n=1 Tax=Stylosanthes scabra TaxID=79078 RepID=A0ABU6Z0T3_9FABA|nr:hypothetical protein [Stylosanthes scabra]
MVYDMSSEASSSRRFLNVTPCFNHRTKFGPTFLKPKRQIRPLHPKYPCIHKHAISPRTPMVRGGTTFSGHNQKVRCVVLLMINGLFKQQPKRNKQSKGEQRWKNGKQRGKKAWGCRYLARGGGGSPIEGVPENPSRANK